MKYAWAVRPRKEDKRINLGYICYTGVYYHMLIFHTKTGAVDWLKQKNPAYTWSDLKKSFEVVQVKISLKGAKDGLSHKFHRQV